MKLTEFLRVVLWLDRSSDHALALARYTKLIVFLTAVFAALFFFGSLNPRLHLSRYYLTLFGLLFFFRALILSIVENGKGQRLDILTLLPTTILAFGSLAFVFLGILQRELDFLAVSSTALIAGIAGFKNIRHGRQFLYFGSFFLLVANITICLLKPDAWTFAAVILTSLGTLAVVKSSREFS